jgi:hypothetical protein
VGGGARTYLSYLSRQRPQAGGVVAVARAQVVVTMGSVAASSYAGKGTRNKKKGIGNDIPAPHPRRHRRRWLVVTCLRRRRRRPKRVHSRVSGSGQSSALIYLWWRARRQMNVAWTGEAGDGCQQVSDG